MANWDERKKTEYSEIEKYLQDNPEARERLIDLFDMCREEMREYREFGFNDEHDQKEHIYEAAMEIANGPDVWNERMRIYDEFCAKRARKELEENDGA
jgi:hypothetical protein